MAAPSVNFGYLPEPSRLSGDPLGQAAERAAEAPPALSTALRPHGFTRRTQGGMVGLELPLFLQQPK